MTYEIAGYTLAALAAAWLAAHYLNALAKRRVTAAVDQALDADFAALLASDDPFERHVAEAVALASFDPAEDFAHWEQEVTR